MYTPNNVAKLLRKILMYAFIVTLKWFECMETMKAKQKTKSVWQKVYALHLKWKNWGIIVD